jgi:hypothetical protein
MCLACKFEFPLLLNASVLVRKTGVVVILRYFDYDWKRTERQSITWDFWLAQTKNLPWATFCTQFEHQGHCVWSNCKPSCRPQAPPRAKSESEDIGTRELRNRPDTKLTSKGGNQNKLSQQKRGSRELKQKYYRHGIATCTCIDRLNAAVPVR